MPNFGQKSQDKLATVHPKLQQIMNEAIKEYDFTVLWGYRDKQLQNSFYRRGTGLKWPNSRHNVKPSLAVDVAPWPIDWLDEQRFVILAGLILAKARELKIEVVWGGLWLRRDLGHFEIRKEEVNG